MTDTEGASATPAEKKSRQPRRAWTRRILLGVFGLGVLGLLGGGAVATWALIHYGQSVPDYRALGEYEPPVMTRVHAGDGSLLTEYATQHRLFVPINAMPEPLLQAFIAAEDKNFYSHSGLDYLGILRAVLTNVRNVITDRRPVGASTITQQVAKNFLLSGEVSYERKIKEAILAMRMERAFTKDQILELYLNEIYLGNRSYGVAAAALNYFNKALDELTLDEIAYLAALPKAPNNYHPVRRYEAAVGRRNWVLGRMEDEGFISDEAREMAAAQPLQTRERQANATFRADYFEEEVRRELKRVYGDKNLYEGGLSVRTSLDPRLQAIAETSLRQGLINYDQRHGWRGPITQRAIDEDWTERLANVPTSLGVDSWRTAIVFDLREGGAIIGFADRTFGFIAFEDMEWARRWLPDQRFGQKPRDVTEVLNIGDVVPVEPLGAEPVRFDDAFDLRGQSLGDLPRFALRQIPDIEGGIVAMDPHTGRVLAMVGGFDYRNSQYNRATQAARQPGSAIKPLVYLAGLEEGFTPSSLVLDAPFVIDQGEGQGRWKPRNSSNQFYGPSTLRLGIEKSRNLMTVRLAQHLGMRRVIQTVDRFGVADNMIPTLAGALGSGEVTLIDLTAAYGMIVNGGRDIEPTFIDRIQDRYGKTLYRTDQRDCDGCDVAGFAESQPPELADPRKQVVDPRHAYQMVSMLEGVVERGTGRRIGSLPWPLAGKTGTSNESFDTWFVGFSRDLVVGVFVGFDQPRTLGRYEEGSSTAAPIFRAFMAEALKGTQPRPFRIPEGIALVRVNAETGLPARPGDQNVILEAFLPGTEPKPGQMLVLDGSGALVQTDEAGAVKRGIY